MAPRLAAVTGGTGFLGRHVVRALSAGGWRVRLLSRRDPVEALGPGVVPEVVAGDLDDDDALRRLCEGAQAVVHAAGLVRARSAAAFRAVNAQGAARVAAATRDAAPGARFVLVSSLAAREPQLSDYARSKREGEAAVRRALGAGAWVARPCAIYGPGDRQTLGLFRAAAACPVLPVLRPEARVTLVHAQDAAAAIAALAMGPAPGADAPVELCDERGEGYGLGEIMRAAGRAVGARPRTAPVPDAGLRVAGLVGAAARALGAAPMLTPGKVREVLHRDWSVAPAARPAGVPAPRWNLADGFGDTVAAHRAAGWLPPARDA